METAHRIPDEPHGVTEPEPHHAVPYFTIFIVLVVLTAVTVLAAMHRFNAELANVGIALAIAAVKASCVALFFMHLRYEGKLIYLICGVPLALCFILVFALIPDILFGPNNRYQPKRYLGYPNDTPNAAVSEKP